MKAPKHISREELPADVRTGELEVDLQCRLAGRVRDFCLIRTHGGIILRGSSRTYYAKQLAQHAVMQATNLPILANEIMVD
jgi:hypothetical protein